jgi:hypothetical protein
MVLLVDEAQVEACFGLFRDSTNHDARWVHGLRLTYHRFGNHFECNGRNSFVMWVMWTMWNLILVHLLIVLILMQNWCTVCAERTIGSEIILDAPDGTHR